MQQKKKTAIETTRAEDFAEWYQKVIRGADLAENSSVRGCMIIKPWGFGVWELLRDDLDRRIRDTGHLNCYFPLFIPLSLIEKEASHVAGFAKEMAVVTHHRIEVDENGKLVPTAPLEEPLIVRPTSETIIGEAFANWIQSYRDLPVLLNQWANVVRWEMRPRMFLRTTEFLWQEGHTAHATRAEAEQETATMLEVYARTLEDALAIPVIKGEKSAGERFPGAVATYSIEAMMQDGRALQAGTSHYLGQNFARAANIRYQTKAGELDHVYTTSWGSSTRMIGALIMTHADDNGLRLPPRVAPRQVVIVPILRGDDPGAILDYCESAKARLAGMSAVGAPIRCHVDARDMPAPEKRWEWIRKGVPLICEVGPRDMAQSAVTYTYRNDPDLGRQTVPLDRFAPMCADTLERLQRDLFDEARRRLAARTVDGIETWADLAAHFSADDSVPYDRQAGFVRAKWSGADGTEQKLKELGVTIRNIPFEQSRTEGKCVAGGGPATTEVILARAY
jgi:prolyl-tRNA synthetase